VESSSRDDSGPMITRADFDNAVREVYLQGLKAWVEAQGIANEIFESIVPGGVFYGLAAKAGNKEELSGGDYAAAATTLPILNPARWFGRIAQRFPRAAALGTGRVLQEAAETVANDHGMVKHGLGAEKIEWGLKQAMEHPDPRRRIFIENAAGEVEGVGGWVKDRQSAKGGFVFIIKTDGSPSTAYEKSWEGYLKSRGLK
jgi:hypothetical protein